MMWDKENRIYENLLSILLHTTFYRDFIWATLVYKNFVWKKKSLTVFVSDFRSKLLPHYVVWRCNANTMFPGVKSLKLQKQLKVLRFELFTKKRMLEIVTGFGLPLCWNVLLAISNISSKLISHPYFQS